MLLKTPAFTLVELIVVITIVGILSTIGFVSYSNYLKWARDSNRYSQLTKLSDSLQVYATQKSLPLPDNYVEITASGASNVIAYQGYIWSDVLETIDYTNGWKDPKDDTFYTYYITKDRKSLQLMALMEEAGSVAQNTFSNNTFAADYSSRYPKVYGRKLWVLTEVDTNTPVQELSSILAGSGYLDIVNTSNEYNATISNDKNDNITWTWASLISVNPEASCKRIKQTWGSKWNWIYAISPLWENLQVYCDMETDWGGWTLIARSVVGGTWNFWWLQKAWNINTTNLSYSLWPIVKSIAYEDMLITRYVDNFNIDIALKIDVDPNFVIAESSFSNTSKECSIILWNLWLSNWCDRFRNWWFINSTTVFHIDDATFNNYWLRANGYYISNTSFWNLLNKQWMMFIK